MNGSIPVKWHGWRQRHSLGILVVWGAICGVVFGRVTACRSARPTIGASHFHSEFLWPSALCSCVLRNFLWGLEDLASIARFNVFMASSAIIFVTTALSVVVVCLARVWGRLVVRVLPWHTTTVASQASGRRIVVLAVHSGSRDSLLRDWFSPPLLWHSRKDKA